MKLSEIVVIAITGYLLYAWLTPKSGAAAKTRNVVNYGGILMSPEQAQMMAQQDAAFVSDPSAYMTAPFNGYA